MKYILIVIACILFIGCNASTITDENETLKLLNQNLNDENKHLYEENVQMVATIEGLSEELELLHSKELNQKNFEDGQVNNEEEIDYDYLFYMLSGQATAIQQFFDSDSDQPFYKIEYDSDFEIIEQISNWFQENIVDGTKLVLIKEILYTENTDTAAAHCVVYDDEQFSYNPVGTIMTGKTPYKFVIFFMEREDNEEWKVVEYRSEF